MPKLTVLGGSSVAVPELVGCIIPYLHSGRALHISLHGRDAHKLELVGGVCQRMAAAAPGLTVETTTDLPAALAGADYVLNQVRVGGLAARAYDETFPHRWTIPGEETVGPGGAANALRTIPVVLEQCRAIAAHAPDALVLSFSNPSSIVQRAVTTVAGLKAIGLCDAPYTMHTVAARTLGVDPAALDTQYIGMHHFGWITSARINGAERLPEVLANDSACAALGLDPAIGRALGVLPHPYFRYFFHPDRMVTKQRGAPSRARELQAIEADLLALYARYQDAAKPAAVERRSAAWYQTVVVPVLVGLAFGEPVRAAINVSNNGLIAALPDDTIIELSAEVRGGQIIAPAPRALPPPALVGTLQANAAYEAALLDAIVQDSADQFLQALLVNPLVPSYDVAREIVAELWPRRGWPPE